VNAIRSADDRLLPANLLAFATIQAALTMTSLEHAGREHDKVLTTRTHARAKAK